MISVQPFVKTCRRGEELRFILLRFELIGASSRGNKYARVLRLLQFFHQCPPLSVPVKSRYDVVILGAGHNGLVAASYLGRAGLSVLLLEKNDYVGGATTSQKVFPTMMRFCHATHISLVCSRRRSFAILG